MSTPSSPKARASEDMLAAAGIVVTDEGKARARATLADADARWTPEEFAQAARKLGLPAKAA